MFLSNHISNGLVAQIAKTYLLSIIIYVSNLNRKQCYSIMAFLTSIGDLRYSSLRLLISCSYLGLCRKEDTRLCVRVCVCVRLCVNVCKYKLLLLPHIFINFIYSVLFEEIIAKIFEQIMS